MLIYKMRVYERRGVIVKRRTIAYASKRPDNAPSRDIMGRLADDGVVESIDVFV